MILFRQYFRIHGSGLVSWSGINGLMAWALAATSKPMESGNALGGFMLKLAEKVPPGLRGLFGVAPGLSAIDSLVQAKIGFWMAIALPIYASLLAVSSVGAEVDRRTADFLLALPVGRQQVIISRWWVMVLNSAILALVTWSALCGGLAFYGVSGKYQGYFWVIAEAWLLGVAVGSMAMLVSLRVGDYGQAVKGSLAGAGALWAVDFGMQVASVPRIARAWNPFSYFDPFNILVRGGLLLGDVLVLIFMSQAMLWLSVVTFESKQVET